jgi:hypothetical protein
LWAITSFSLLASKRIAKYNPAGTAGLENRVVFQVPEVQKALGKPAEVPVDTKRRMFAA